MKLHILKLKKKMIEITIDKLKWCRFHTIIAIIIEKVNKVSR